MVFRVIESAASHLTQLWGGVSHRQRLPVADNQRVLHVLLRRGLVAKSFHLVLRTLGRTLGGIDMKMRMVTSLHNLHLRVNISSWGLLLVYDVRCHRTVAKSLSNQLLLIEALIEPVLRGSAVVGLGFGRQGTGIKRLVDQVAQYVRLLGHID